ncbi:MAG TPA: hypothetical protein VK978_04100 [Candidatus Saccharimonadales bacterium]|nr:hypothetical protein [Candidatus Saccharimonadales bacterium]
MATETENKVRPTKKQRELLSYIEQFIAEHGYSPSYREIMNGLNYTSVATVALHVTSLIRRGHLRKRTRSARSLEVVSGVAQPAAAPAAVLTQSEGGTGEQWLIQKVEGQFTRVEKAAAVSVESLADLRALVDSLCLLDMTQAAEAFRERLLTLENKAVFRGE